MSSCGKNTQTIIENLKETTVEVEKAQEFEGFYSFDNNSQIELIAGADQEIHVLRDFQILNTINPQNNTIGTFPVFSKSALEIKNNALFFSLDLNYKDGNDIEEDDNGANIRGRKRTDVTIQKTETGIRMTLQVYSNRTNDNLNFIIATRVFESK